MCDAPFSLGLQSGVIFASQPYGLPLNETIMPQYFQKLGYRRHMVGKVSTVVDIVSCFILPLVLFWGSVIKKLFEISLKLQYMLVL